MSRDSLCLNGEWDFMPVYGVKACLDIPEAVCYEKEKIRVPSSWRFVTLEGTPYYKSGFGVVDDFEPYNLFNYPKEWSRAETGVYSRRFVLPEHMCKGRVFLRFDGIMQMSRIYLNGQVAGEWDEAYLPLRIDVTGLVKKDGQENELMVVCTTFNETTIASGQTKSLGLIGSWYGNLGRGIWQDVYVESFLDTHIEDVFIRTSVREKVIGSQITVCNTTEQPKNVTLRISIRDGENTVLDYCLDPVKVGAHETETISTLREWPNPRLWDIENPYLYHMQAELLEDGAVIDSKTVRFGFREVWSEGHRFMLNGIRVNLRGDSWHFQGASQQTKEYALNWFRMCRDNGINFVRLHAEPHPEYYLEAADEAGMMIVDETAIYGSAKSMPADHPVYLSRCKKHVKRLVVRDRNHPSIILWSIQNEMRWVDGRDTYKLIIPEMMDIVRRLDGTRPSMVEGDNRLLPKEATGVESYHYNIDGTIAQWDRKKPLVFGEHGGWWYLSPQNSSIYAGLRAYLDVDDSSEGMAMREKIYVEYARRNEVTGITSFNFAHYMKKSMPDEDIVLHWDRLDTPGCKPKVIRKHSLTINNGYLGDAPLYKSNIAEEVLRDSYRPVVILPSEYNTSFYDGGTLTRNFDVYNDTLAQRDCRVEIRVGRKGDEPFCYESFQFTQAPGERKTLTISFEPPMLYEAAELLLEGDLLHNEAMVYRLARSYKLYPQTLKYQKLDNCNKRVAFWGGNRDFHILAGFLAGCARIDSLPQLTEGRYDVVIIGSYINDHAEAYQELLGDYAEKGGVVVVLEQFKFALGDLVLVKQPFFSAHANDSTHPILNGIRDEDLIFWKPDILEDKPEDIVNQSFMKPVKGDINIILEASAGDFGDGGDLWTPLVEYGYGEGTVIINQLELMENCSQVPQACVLLGNILEYALSLEPRKKSQTGLITGRNSAASRLFDAIGLQYGMVESTGELEKYKNVIVDANYVCNDMITKLYEYVKQGGNILVLPAAVDKTEVLSGLTGGQVTIKAVPTYQLKKAVEEKILKGISVVDLYRFEKVTCSPRMVENIELCSNSIELQQGTNLLVSVTGQPWYDYFVRKYDAEFSRVALVDINRKTTQKELPYLVEKSLGKGRVIASQISTDTKFEKNIRIYSRLLANLGAEISTELFSYIKGERDNSADYLMVLPHQEYQDYEKALAYFTDKEYSLNNLGEGLYGWMQKIEKNVEDGFINIPDSKGRTYFITCFPVVMDDRTLEKQSSVCECILQMDVNCSFKLWINGNPVKAFDKKGYGKERIAIENIRLENGLNRLAVVCSAGEEDISIRPVFKDMDGSFIDNIRYQLTIDEVDPK